MLISRARFANGPQDQAGRAEETGGHAGPEQIPVGPVDRQPGAGPAGRADVHDRRTGRRTGRGRQEGHVADHVARARALLGRAGRPVQTTDAQAHRARQIRPGRPAG